MADIVKGANQHWDAPPKWHYYEVTMETATGADVNVALDTIPRYTVIMDCRVYVSRIEAGATSSALDVEVGVLTLYDTGADSLGASTAMFIAPTVAELAGVNGLLQTAGQTLNCEIAYSGTASQTPIFTVGVLGGRVSY